MSNVIIPRRTFLRDRQCHIRHRHADVPAEQRSHQITCAFERDVYGFDTGSAIESLGRKMIRRIGT